ncbi:hypothetical protein PO909_029661, partial [Leuciscus waleckii]
MNKKNDEISNLTQSQVEELRKENRDREIAFSASVMQSGGGYIGPFTSEITLTYRNIFTNIGNAYNPITGIFTAPLKGAYMFRVSVFGVGGILTTAAIVKNGKHVVIAHDIQAQAQDRLNSSNGVLLILEVGDVVYVRLWSGTRIYDDGNNHNTFSGFLLFPLSPGGRLSRRRDRVVFFLISAKKNQNTNINFYLICLCYTSIDPVKCVFFLCILTIKTKCCAFRQIKKNKHEFC